MDTAKPYQFGRIGGALCLDFTNTASWEADEQTSEHLNDFPDLVRWCTEAALVDQNSTAALVEKPEENRADAAAVLAKAKDLRATLYRIFIAVSRGKLPASKDLQLLNEALAQTPFRLEVRRAKDLLFSERKAGGTKFAELLGPVVLVCRRAANFWEHRPSQVLRQRHMWMAIFRQYKKS